MKRVFWLGVGVAAGVALSRKASETARQATPAGLASNVGDAVRELAGALGAFGADVRAGMSEREQELNQIVQRPVTPARPPEAGARPAQAARPQPQRAPQQRPAPRSGAPATGPARAEQPRRAQGERSAATRRARAPRAEG